MSNRQVGRRCAGVAAFLVIATAASAQTTGQQSAPTLGASIVTATRTVTEVDEVLAPVIVITREELERGLAPDVASLLQFHAGIDLGRNGGPGQVSSIFIRGTDSNHATVLIDGVRINPATIGGAQLQNISPETIERIEIVKGPRSTLYGTDAVGGVINVITRSYRDNAVEVSAGGGRYGTRQAAFSGGFGGEAGDFVVSGSWFDSEGFPARVESSDDRGFENTSFAAKGRVHVGPVELGVRAWRAEGTTEYSDFFLSPVDQDFETASYATEAAVRPTDRWLSRLTLSRIEDDIVQNQSIDRVRTRRNAIDWQNDLRVGERNVLTAGVLLTRENAMTADPFGSGFDVDTDVDMVFAQDRFDFGRHNLLAAVAWYDHETFGTQFPWNLDYGLDIGGNARIVASVGSAFRAPDATDRFGFGGNPDLEPEVSHNYEIAFQQRLGAHELGAAAFRNDIEELVDFVVLDPETFEIQNRNIERARIEGVELSYGYRGESWRLRTEASIQNPRNLSEDTHLLRRARESLTASFVKSLPRSEVGLDVLVTGSREDFGGVRLGGYTLVNLTGRFYLTENWSLQARLENVLDEQYVLASNFNTPDRSLTVASRVRF